MSIVNFPYVSLPNEFLNLLKSNIPATSPSGPIFDVLRPNKALYAILESCFKEFDDGRGVEKVMAALGWSNFRDRLASIYVYKTIYGAYPAKTDMELSGEIKNFENRFIDHSVNGFSRVFMLGFYLRLANLSIQHAEDNQFLEIKVPEEIGNLLKLSQGRSEKVDWLILILFHLNAGLGDKLLLNGLLAGKKFEDLYSLMAPDAQENMHQNLLAYGASIQEPDVFFNERV